ncbi:DNA ligase D [Halalkalibacillus halophilus]|uniref:DNA ligase D n=1 Tax=Halalkalibacillus halophilus TaxID=392827 RepID=UPI00042A29F7|nr:DNA ligase D [Halalkalibacillus halophilus]
MWKPMLPTLMDEPPTDEDWIYEIKYDGFRCGLEWNESGVKLWSRNGNDLSRQFPEILDWCTENRDHFKTFFPLHLDGEIVILNTPLQSNFSQVQQRGRMKSVGKIKSAAISRPSTLMVFDLVMKNGKSLKSFKYHKRRAALEEMPWESRLKLVDTYEHYDEAFDKVFLHQGEGVVAKKITNKYVEGKRTDQWIKIKNWRTISGIITSWNLENDYFGMSIYNDKQLIDLGKIKHGFSDEEKNTLTQLIRKHGENIGSSWKVSPSICVDVHCLHAHEGELREPVFKSFRHDLVAKDCTMEQVKTGLAMLPKNVELSNQDKLIFDQYTKKDLIFYLRKIAPLLLPKIKDKRLTMIRFPDGVDAHSFYQKHLPDYAPDYIQSIGEDLLCQDLQSLIWFGNQAGVEYHVPFQTIHSSKPDEMVFDLDPPSLNEFNLAIKAAHLIKQMCEHHGYKVYAKTSGRTGLQLHVPIEDMTFAETRTFMEAVANVLTQKYPDSFTTERLIKNRGKRLYIDYVQHAEGKTIIAPYSPRGTKEATVATPLFWEEVKEGLDPRQFTIGNVVKRMEEKGCPWVI